MTADGGGQEYGTDNPRGCSFQGGSLRGWPSVYGFRRGIFRQFRSGSISCKLPSLCGQPGPGGGYGQLRHRRVLLLCAGPDCDLPERFQVGESDSDLIFHLIRIFCGLRQGGGGRFCPSHLSGAAHHAGGQHGFRGPWVLPVHGRRTGEYAYGRHDKRHRGADCKEAVSRCKGGGGLSGSCCSDTAVLCGLGRP